MQSQWCDCRHIGIGVAVQRNLEVGRREIKFRLYLRSCHVREGVLDLGDGMVLSWIVPFHEKEENVIRNAFLLFSYFLFLS